MLRMPAPRAGQQSIKPGEKQVKLANNIMHPARIVTDKSPLHSSMSLRSRPLNFQHFNVTFPQDRIVQVTLNRPEKLNCINKATSQEIKEIWELFDQDESLWVGIITGTERAFCTGADLQGRLLSLSIPHQVFTWMRTDQC